MSFEDCYVYVPVGRKDSRPTKKRRVGELGLQSSWPLRQSLYQRLWSDQHQRLQESSNKVPSAVILTGPSIASHGPLFDQLSKKITGSDESVFVSLTSSLAPNLKTLLKNLIQRATASDARDDDDDDEIGLAKVNRKRPRYLNYDLQLLFEYVKDKEASKVVVAFQDCEAFDGPLLSDAIELLSCWRDRIPFVFFFGVATSIENFQAKLAKKATRYIAGQRFDVVKAESALEQAFNSLHSGKPTLWLGAGICAAMLRRQRDHIQSLDAFVDSVQYAYLAHFYANAPSVFLDEGLDITQISKEHFEALRNLPSFQSHVETLLVERQASLVRNLLDSNEELLLYVKKQLSDGREAVAGLVRAVDVMNVLQTSFPAAQQTARSTLLVDALAGQLSGSVTERTLLLSLRKSNSDAFRETLGRLIQIAENDLHDSCKVLLEELERLLESQGSRDTTLRSEEDVNNSTLRTTVIAKKVELSKQKSALTKGDAAYSSLLRRFAESFEEYISASLIDPKELVFNELFIYDLKSPHRDVFTPKPRFAIERALAAPHDYLDCSCCAPDNDGGDENTLGSTQPSTAILYQLYLESGALINVSDLRAAFVAIVGGESQDETRIS
ncbi:hypothetical protein MBLNU459_g4622t2 [Dothideomycetes sp. NU459]